MKKIKKLFSCLLAITVLFCFSATKSFAKDEAKLRILDSQNEVAASDLLPY